MMILGLTALPALATVEVNPANALFAWDASVDAGDIWTGTLRISNLQNILVDTNIQIIRIGIFPFSGAGIPAVTGAFIDFEIEAPSTNVVNQAVPFNAFANVTFAPVETIGGQTDGDFEIRLEIDAAAATSQFLVRIQYVQSDDGGDVLNDSITVGPIMINGGPVTFSAIGSHYSKKFNLGGGAPMLGLGGSQPLLRFWLKNQGDPAKEDRFAGYSVTFTDVRGFLPTNTSASLRDLDKMHLFNSNNDTLLNYSVGVNVPHVPGGTYNYLPPVPAAPLITIPPNTGPSMPGSPVELRFGVTLNSQIGYATPGETGAVIPGDAFILQIDGYWQWVDYDDAGVPLYLAYTPFNQCVTKTVHEVLRFPDTYMMVAATWRDQESSGLDDGTALDRISWFPIYGLHMISGPAQPTRMLDRIDLRIVGPRAAQILSHASPFAAIDGFTALSGIQVRKNVAGAGVDEDDQDEDGVEGPENENAVSFTSRDDFDNDDMLVNFFWANPTMSSDTLSNVEIIRYADTEIVVRLNFAGVPGNEQARSLPTVGFKKANTPFDTTRGTKPDYWIGIIPSDSSFFGETFVFSIDSIVIGTTPQNSDPIFQSRSNAIVGVPIILENLVGDGQFIAANSTAQTLAAFSAHDARHFAHLSALQFYVLGDSGLTFADFMPMNALNPESSGFAIYRDADGVAGNSNGAFDRYLDTPIRMIVGRATFEALPWNSIQSEFGAENGFRVFMELDTQGGANPLTRLPLDNMGANAGNDFFLAARTSSSATSGRRFRIVFGELEENDKDGIYGYITFETMGASIQAKSRVFSRAFIVDGADTYRYGMSRKTDEEKNAFYRVKNNFRTGFITVGGAIGATYVEQIAAPRTVYPGDSFVAFGVNAFAGTTLRINSAMADVVANTAGFDSTALKSIPAIVAANSVPGGVAFYVDTGIDDTGASRAGKWNVGLDPLAPAQITAREAAGVLRCTFFFIPPLNVPQSDLGTEAGSDFFVALWLSDSALFRDSFQVRMPDSAINFSDPGSISSPPMLMTPLLTVGMPFRLKSVLNRSTLPTSGVRLPVLGFSAMDTTRAGDGGVLLNSVIVDLDDVAGSGFSLNSLAALTTDSTSGVALWYDRDSDGAFNETLDTPIPLTSISSSLSRRVTLTVANQDVPDIDPNFSHDTKARFFIVVRANAAAAELTIGHKFTASIPLFLPGGAVQFTAPVNPNLVLTTSGIEFAPDDVNGAFSPVGYGPATTASLSIGVGIPDSWFIRFYNLNAETVPLYRFPSSGVWLGSTDTLVLNQELGPRVTGIYKVEMVYYDGLGREQTFGFGGQTLTVDSFAVPPSYDSAYTLVTPTTTSTADLRILIDTTATANDSTARLFGEAGALVQIYRLIDTGLIFAGSANLSNYRGVVNVTLQSGVNTFYGAATDSFGNRSETVFIAAVQRNVGANVLDVRLHPEIRTWIEPGETIPVLSVNLTQNAAGEVINAIRLVISESVPGAFTFGKNIAGIGDALAETAGIQLWWDRGTRGVWDVLDQRIRLATIAVTEGTGAGRAILELIPEIAIPVPPNDTGLGDMYLGDDIFIAVRGGDGALFRDSFFLHLPPNAFVFGGGGGRSNVTDTLTAGPIRTRVSRLVTAADSQTSVLIYPGGPTGSWTALFALDLNDSTRFGDGGAGLSGIGLTLSDSNAYLLDFRLFKDNRGTDTSLHGRYTSDDTAVTTGISINSGISVSLFFSGDTAIPHASDTNTPDFILAVRVNPAVSLIVQDIDFSIEIPVNGVSTSGDDPGGRGVTPRTVTIKAGRAGIDASSITPNPFSPNDDGVADTAGLFVSFADSRGCTITVTRGNGSETWFHRVAYFRESTVVFSTTAKDTTASWVSDVYTVSVTDTLTMIMTTAPLYVDLAAVAPTAASTNPTATSNASAAFTFTMTAASDPSTAYAKSRSERDSFMLVFRISSTTFGDTYDTAVSAYPAISSDTTLTADVTRTLNLWPGVNTVNVTLIDRVGNRDSSLTFSVTRGTGISGLIQYEQPLFRYTPTNRTFRIAFPTTVAQGAQVEIYNIAGDRLRLIPIPAGQSHTDWDAANNAGQILRNGVYILKFKVPLADGRVIDESRTIFLLK